MIVEEFAPKGSQHIADEDNAVTDYLSQLEMEHRNSNLIKTEAPKSMPQYCNMLQNTEQLNSLKETFDEAFFAQVSKLMSKAQQECEVLKKKLTAEDYKK